MLVNSNFGIVPDRFETIVSAQVTKMQAIFGDDASNIDSPAYTIAYLQATGISALQQSLQTLWNSINADTANGLGLDILSNVIYDFTRPKKKSFLAVRCDVTITPNKTGTLSTGTSLTFLPGVSPTSQYYLAAAFSWTDAGTGNPVSTVLVFESEDLTTAIQRNMVDTISVGPDSIDVVSVTKSNVDPWSTEAVLGGLDSDEQFQIKRKIYMGVLGQTALGIQKAITMLNIPGLNGVYVQEYITSTVNGIIVYVDYPTVVPPGTTPPAGTPSFDSADPNLQKIAQTIYDYKAFGIVSLGINGATVGDTPFRVTRSFTNEDYVAGYTAVIYLNPMTYADISMTLTMEVTIVATDVSLGQTIFPVNKANNPSTVKEEIRLLINQYFLSKYRPGDNTFTLADVFALIQKQYTGILGFSVAYFGTSSSKANYIFRQTGNVFQLPAANFSFSLVVKRS